VSLHDSTFLYLKPTDRQVQDMDFVREAFKNMSKVLEQHLPDGPDKTYVIRHLRETAMWAHVAITRHQDGAPRV
jgi:hypothetical protein